MNGFELFCKFNGYNNAKVADRLGKTRQVLTMWKRRGNIPEKAIDEILCLHEFNALPRDYINKELSENDIAVLKNLFLNSELDSLYKETGHLDRRLSEAVQESDAEIDFMRLQYKFNALFDKESGIDSYNIPKLIDAIEKKKVTVNVLNMFVEALQGTSGKEDDTPEGRFIEDIETAYSKYDAEINRIEEQWERDEQEIIESLETKNNEESSNQ